MRSAGVALTIFVAVVSGFGGTSPSTSGTSRLGRIIPPQGSRGVPAPDEYTRESAVLAVDDARNPTAGDLRMLAGIVRANHSRAGPSAAERRAVRALGRMERAEAVPLLIERLEDPALSADAAFALLLVLRAALPQHPDDPQLTAARDLLLHGAAPSMVLGYLPYDSASQVEAAEIKLRRALEVHTPPASADARALEVLARLNRKRWHLTDDTLNLLRRLALREDPRLPFDDDDAPRNAMAALMSAGAADAEVIAHASDDRAEEVRRLAALALFSTGASIDAEQRTGLARQALRDSSALVRYEAIRAWARHETVAHGCEPLLLALHDGSMHVALAAIDALATRCPASDDATDALAAEARTPPTIGEWQHEAHALVALARRAPDRAAVAMSTFRQHQVWQVRMYAARAAAVLKDAVSLERLAYDENDNVRDAALPALRALRHGDSAAAFIAALGRRDHQLLRTAAMELKDASPSKELLAALTSALERVTAEKKDTSRDTRLALIERIRALGSRDQYGVFERLLRDFDPRVAAAAAAACSDLSGKAVAADPQPLRRPAPPTYLELTERLAARIEIDSGRSFQITFDKLQAPLAYSRFARLVRSHYYDGLTFHRVVGNFVVQGGGPGENEYAGETSYWRDELGAPNVRGTVGISTRGRDTGDGQFYINLVDNRSLDFEYSVFGRVRPEDMAVVDAIAEGTKIVNIGLVPSPGHESVVAGR